MYDPKSPEHTYRKDLKPFWWDQKYRPSPLEQQQWNEFFLESLKRFGEGTYDPSQKLDI